MSVNSVIGSVTSGARYEASDVVERASRLDQSISTLRTQIPALEHSIAPIPLDVAVVPTMPTLFHYIYNTVRLPDNRTDPRPDELLSRNFRKATDYAYRNFFFIAL